jgi:lipopolysaccharide transport system ATP-binding protein
MSNTVISVEDLSKSYRLGVIGTGTFYGDLRRWWAKQRGKPDPYLKVNEANHSNRNGEIVWALRDLNFSVRQGEAVGIIGRNGAGKSTLLKILSQVTAPTSGIAKVKGRIASLLEVGTGFHPELTGRENIYLNGAILGMNRQEIARKFDEIVGFSGVEKFIDTPVKRYSSGMYVRLAFAVAAHLEPEILIVDEVLAVGDFEFQRKCLGRMNEVAHEGRTVLFVSHNLPMVSSLCNTCILLDNGHLVEYDNTARVLATYYGTDLQNTVDSKNMLPANAGGNDVQLLKAWVSDDRGQIRTEYSILEGIKLHMKYRVSRDLTDSVIPFFHVLNSKSEYVFLTWPRDWKPGISAKKGEYVAVCDIPAHFLNDGVYSVTVQVNSVDVGHNLEFFEHHAISFVVLDSIHENPYRLHTKFSYEVPGAVRPLLNWQLQKTVEEAE